MDSSSVTSSPFVEPISRSTTARLPNNFKDVLDSHMATLSLEDREVLTRSRAQFLNHCFSGLTLGVAVGITYSFRKRIISHLRGHTVEGKIRKPIFPTFSYIPKEGATAEEIKEGAKLAGEESGRLMNKLIWRVSGWGLAGGAFGLQMGLFTGTTAGKATLATRPGVEARATKVMLQAIKESQLEMGIQESDFGKVPGGESAGEYGQKEFSGPGEVSSISKETESRWASLRASNTPPSSWDKIRSSSSPLSSASSSSSSSFNDENETNRNNRVSMTRRKRGELPDPGSDEMFNMNGDGVRVRPRETSFDMEEERRGNSRNSEFK